jgi:hypothetical protein
VQPAYVERQRSMVPIAERHRFVALSQLGGAEPDYRFRLEPNGVGLKAACLRGRHRRASANEIEAWIVERDGKVFWQTENDGRPVCAVGSSRSLLHNAQRHARPLGVADLAGF